MSKSKTAERSRREFLRDLAVTTSTVGVVGALAGCEGDPSGEAPDAALDPDAAPPEPDAALPDPDAALPDPDAAAPDPDAAPPAGEPDLQPLRGDGSHPYHYIDTIVLVQMENRSFDHMMGALALEEGRTDVDGLRAEMSNPDSEGGVHAVRPLGALTALEFDPHHGWNSCHLQWNEGANDGFVRDFETILEAGGPELVETRRGDIMGYYTRAQLPATYGLADAFTVCNRWHASLLGPTWPNRYYSHCASSGGLRANNGLCLEPTPYPALVEAGFSYKCYYTSLFFTLTINSLPQKNAVKMDAFFADCEAGTLPNVSIVEPSFFQNDDHPPADVRNGQGFIATVYEALRRSPQWNRMLVLFFYDEHGGFFDHVPPPTAQGDTREAEGFAQLGFRIPGLIAGPLARRRFAFDGVVDHASIPKQLAEVFEVPHVNERARLAGSFEGALDVELAKGANRPPPPTLPPVILPEASLDTMFKANLQQPELEDWFRKMGRAHHSSAPERRRLIRNYLLTAKRLGSIQFV